MWRKTIQKIAKQQMSYLIGNMKKELIFQLNLPAVWHKNLKKTLFLRVFPSESYLLHWVIG